MFVKKAMGKNVHSAGFITNMPPRWGSEIESEINLLQICRSYGANDEHFISIVQVVIFFCTTY